MPREPAPSLPLRPVPRNSATAFDRMEDLIGCVSGGPPDLSDQTGKKLPQLLRHTHRQAATRSGDQTAARPAKIPLPLAETPPPRVRNRP